MSFWDVVWLIIISFAFFAYLMILFQILTDLFRDRELNGWWKAVWLVAFIFLPLLSTLVYLIARGPSMWERQDAALADYQARQNAYIRDVAAQGSSPAEEIAKAAQLRDHGDISETEFNRIKERVLA